MVGDVLLRDRPLLGVDDVMNQNFDDVFHVMLFAQSSEESAVGWQKFSFECLVVEYQILNFNSGNSLCL